MTHGGVRQTNTINYLDAGSNVAENRKSRASEIFMLPANAMHLNVMQWTRMRDALNEMEVRSCVSRGPHQTAMMIERCRLSQRYIKIRFSWSLSTGKSEKKAYNREILANFEVENNKFSPKIPRLTPGTNTFV